MSKLSWIDDERLNDAVSRMLQRAQKAKDKAEVRIKENVVDPFSSIILAATIDLDDVMKLSDIQQITSMSSGISSAVGNFHQEVLGFVEGFRNHDAGYDLECSDKQIVAEIKNKHNTMNASNREKVINDLDTAVRQKTGSWAAYLVVIIPGKPRRYKKKLRNRVYEIDGASFYALATGSETAVYTDNATAYNGLPRNHGSVNHSVSEYVRNQIHTNRIKSFWALLKRGCHGTFHCYEQKTPIGSL